VDSAQYLSEWKRRHHLSDVAAAEWLCISVSAFRRQRRGEVRLCRQTVRLAELYPIYNVGWLDLAETATKVGRLLSKPPFPGQPLVS
jgi:hypothetical protein